MNQFQQVCSTHKDFFLTSMKHGGNFGEYNRKYIALEFRGMLTVKEQLANKNSQNKTQSS